MIFKSFKQKSTDKQATYGSDTFYQSKNSSFYKTKSYPEQLTAQQKVVHQCAMEVSMEIKLMEDKHNKIIQETEKDQQIFYNQLHELEKNYQKPMEKSSNKNFTDAMMKRIKQKNDNVEKKISDKITRLSDKIRHSSKDLKDQMDSCEEILTRQGKERQVQWSHSIDAIGQLLFDMEKLIRDEKHQYSTSLNTLEASIWKMQQKVQFSLEKEKRQRSADHSLITNLIEATMAKLIMFY